MLLVPAIYTIERLPYNVDVYNILKKISFIELEYIFKYFFSLVT